MIKKLIALNLILFFVSCQKSRESNNAYEKEFKISSSELIHSQEPIDSIRIFYKKVESKQWLENHKNDSLKQRIIFAINRTDLLHLTRMDSIIVPNDFNYKFENYLPFPLEVNYLKDIHKIIFFSYPTQTFAAYEKGKLKITGPTNMGREEYLTPTGLFFTNWKAKVKVSTIDDDWILNWNFNILNKEGIGWHEYSLPGYPASHSCLRLQKKDAKFLYSWADQWVLADQFTIKIKGTPVVIFGKYDFSLAKPWLNLISNPKSIDITEEEIQKITKPYLKEILSVQRTKDTIQVLNQ